MPKVTVEHLNARRAQIMEAARACFARKGFAQSTIQDICAEAGLSPGAIYRYFKSKSDIVFAIGDESREMVLGMIEEMKGRHTALEVLDFIGERFFGLLAEPAAEQQAMLGHPELWAETLRNPEMREHTLRSMRAWRDALAALIEKGQEEGIFDREIDPEACAMVLIATFEGLQLQLERNPELVDVRRFYDTMRGLIWREAWDHLRQSPGSRRAAAREGKE
jgi:AcrR family transcriptional regulator